MKTDRRKPRRSLRTILVVWFTIFSIIPLAFVSIYSLRQFEAAINKELGQRLSGNVREISSILSDYKVGLSQKRDIYTRDPNFIYHVTVEDSTVVKGVITNWIRQDFSSTISVFNREGKMIVSVAKDEKNNIQNFVPTQEAVFLSAGYLAKLKGDSEIGIIDPVEQKKLSLVLISRIVNTSGKVVGFLEQVVDLDQKFLSRLKNRMKLELLIFKEDGNLILGSHPDFSIYKTGFFRKYIDQSKESFFELSQRGVPLGFVVQPLTWGETKFFIGLGASKSDSRAALQNIYIAFISVVSAVALLLLLTIFVTSKWLLKPIYELVEALQSFESQEQAITISIKNDTEIGLLTESFNEMSKKIWQARSDLRKKISELEGANKELKETQTKLVHSAKMISLGQLVAGVAHELNNPISFINANMSHLKEYSDKLIKIVDASPMDSSSLENLKSELEYDYIKADLPKLISSCQEGARRTRDIVLGLRNFSRLDAAKLQEVDLHLALDTTLNLLQGEIKGRVQIHKVYGAIPAIHCYASQINQVFMNILSNALQAIEGTGQIWITTSSLPNRKVQISIQDSGKGMSQETLDKIFDPFFTTKGVGQGTGLGLSISYGIIQNHGGDISARSQVNVGTEFVIELPIHPPTQE